MIALQAETGKPLWTHEPEPKLDRAYDKQHSLICRGVSFWQEATPDPSKPCQSRIYQGVLDGRLEALDARTGELCGDFGVGGTIDLNLMDNGGEGVVNVTSAPVVFEDMVIVGSAISDNHAIDMPSGFVRAFDARTGAEHWHWSPIPRGLRFQTGAGNVWAPMSVDTERGILYAPTTSPSPDYWGGMRTDPLPGVDSIVALNARTGEMIWHFQTVHHNLFDYDLPAQPTLIDVKRDGQTDSSRRAADQDRLPVGPEPGDRRAAVPGGRAARRAVGRAGRSELADAARAAAASPSGSATSHRRRYLGPHADRPRGLRAPYSRAAQRRAVHSAEPAGQSGRALFRRWLELGRHGLRPGFASGDPECDEYTGLCAGSSLRLNIRS